MSTTDDIGECVAKKVHGTPEPKNIPFDMVMESPIPCDFKAGDLVVFTNSNGVEFEKTVRGFTAQPQGPTGSRFVYLDLDCWWFAVAPTTIRLRSDTEPLLPSEKPKATALRA